MTAVDDFGDSRPPPSRQKNIRLFTKGIPWYRDLRVLRIIAQVVFAAGFIGGITWLVRNLTRNLRVSDLSIDFNTYKTPFTVAIPEGISATEPWGWVSNADFIWDMTRLGWFGLFFLLFFLIARRYKTDDIRFGPSSVGALFGAVGLLMPLEHDQLPGDLSDVLDHYLGIGSSIIGIILWLALLGAAVYALYRICQGYEQQLLTLVGAMILLAAAIIIYPGELLNPLALVALVTLAASAYLIFQMYLYEQIDISSAITLGMLVFLIAFMHPVERATVANVDRLGEYLAADGREGTVTRAFITGIFNTLRVVVTSLIACTILGIFVGIGLLSSNWLVRNVSKVYVEIFRNTPLLIQLLFIYRTMTLLLPSPRDSKTFFLSPSDPDKGYYFLNARGLWYPGIGTTDTFSYLAVATILGLAIAYFVRRYRLQRQELTGEPAYVFRFTMPIIVGFIVAGWVIAGIAGDGPFTVELPSLPEGARNVEGGGDLSVAFVALFLGLTLYTAAFVADIVRAGIQSVPYGQIEAARAAGLKGSQVLSLVVLPQALRLIIPPLGNQYVNLGKNSSLGLAVTYVETFKIAQLANNEKGQAVAYFVALMGLYLSLSLTLSLLTNIANRMTRVKSR